MKAVVGQEPSAPDTILRAPALDQATGRGKLHETLRGKLRQYEYGGTVRKPNHSMLADPLKAEE